MAGHSDKVYLKIAYWDIDDEQHRSYELVLVRERGEFAYHDKVIQALDLERLFLIVIAQEMQEKLDELEEHLKGVNQEMGNLRGQLKDKDEFIIDWMLKDYQNSKKSRPDNETTQGNFKRK